VKTNAGLFKSENQARFLLNQLERVFGKNQDGTYEYVVTGNVYGNSYHFGFTVDEKGVVKVEKHATKSGKYSTYFERPASEGDFTALQDKHAAKKVVKDLLKKDFEEFNAQQEQTELEIKALDDQSNEALNHFMKFIGDQTSPEYLTALENLKAIRGKMKELEDRNLAAREDYQNFGYRDELLKKYNLTAEDLR
jgi:DNA-binding protein H-NS